MTTNILITSLWNKIIEFWYEWIWISEYSLLNIKIKYSELRWKMSEIEFSMKRIFENRVMKLEILLSEIIILNLFFMKIT